MTLDLYSQMIDERPQPIGFRNWIGNLRWIAQEVSPGADWLLHTCPIGPEESEFVKPVGSIPGARRTLLAVSIEPQPAISKCTYFADRLHLVTAAGELDFCFPMTRFGAILEWSGATDRPAVRIRHSMQADRQPSNPTEVTYQNNPDRLDVADGAYQISIRHNGIMTEGGGGFDLKPAGAGLRVAFAFHVAPEAARAEAEDLFSKVDAIREESRRAWNDYLQSCPTTAFKNDYTYHNAFLNEYVTFTKEEINTRQLWHWHSVLANASDLPFNRMPTNMSPDRCIWFGAWSNDSPENMRALAATGQHGLARRIMIDYVRHAVTPEGDLCWYLHATGVPCLGNPKDSGRFSHGVPVIVRSIHDYIQWTRDRSILDADAGDEMSVYERLKLFFTRVFDRRDINGDGMVEWVNLWEGGPDDKVGAFFTRADLGAWVEAVTTKDDEDLKEFYKEKSCPVVNLYEQYFFLDALEAMKKLAAIQKDRAFSQYCAKRFSRIVSAINDRHWDEATGFYYDWDVRNDRLTVAKNLDAFYLLRLLGRPDRANRMIPHLLNTAEFNLRYTPSLSRDSEGFNPDGYWCGGYWPREATYLAQSLDSCGWRALARQLVLKALCSERGKVISENMNPLTGVNTTRCTDIAYCCLLNLLLTKLGEAEPPTSL